MAHATTAQQRRDASVSRFLSGVFLVYFYLVFRYCAQKTHSPCFNGLLFAVRGTYNWSGSATCWLETGRNQGAHLVPTYTVAPPSQVYLISVFC